jgi:hypothetical protein
LKLFDEDPEEYAAVFVHKTHEAALPSGPMIVGTEVEDYLFRGELPNAVLIPEKFVGKMMNNPEYCKWAQNRPKGKKAVTLAFASSDPKLRKFIEIRRNIDAHPIAKELIYGDTAKRHQAIMWRDEETGIERMCQLDILHETSCIGDLKTASSIELSDFESAIFRYKYHWQGATYQDAVEALIGKRLPFFFLVVKKEGGFGVEVIQASEELLELGRYEYRNALRRFKKATESAAWRSATHGKIVTAHVPYYRGLKLTGSGRPIVIRPGGYL